MSQVAEMGTVEYMFSKLYPVNDTNIFWTCKILFKTEAHVKAGISMDGFDRSRVHIDETAGKNAEKYFKALFPTSDLFRIQLKYFKSYEESK